MVISPDSAKMLRHPKEAEEAGRAKSQDEDGVGGVDQHPEVAEADDSAIDDLYDGGPELSPFFPTSPGELYLSFVLAFPSLLFILYLVVVLYRCVCSRNYAEWRSSWTVTDPSKQFGEISSQVRLLSPTLLY